AFQETQMKIANMATDLEASRLLYLRAASMKDKGLIFSQQASMAKLFASETAVRCTGQALQIHGGYGYIDDYPVERFLRDSRILTIGEGTSEVQRLVIAKGVLATFKA
ncbi:MAG: acyl-CoA dehydrogenase family protein, partial [Nitrospinota bacterium]